MPPPCTVVGGVGLIKAFLPVTNNDINNNKNVEKGKHFNNRSSVTTETVEKSFK